MEECYNVYMDYLYSSLSAVSDSADFLDMPDGKASAGDCVLDSDADGIFLLSADVSGKI